MPVLDIKARTLCASFRTFLLGELTDFHWSVKKSRTKMKKARTSASSINNHLGTAVCLILPESLLVDSKW